MVSSGIDVIVQYICIYGLSCALCRLTLAVFPCANVLRMSRIVLWRFNAREVNFASHDDCLLFGIFPKNRNICQDEIFPSNYVLVFFIDYVFS